MCLKDEEREAEEADREREEEDKEKNDDEEVVLVDGQAEVPVVFGSKPLKLTALSSSTPSSSVADTDEDEDDRSNAIDTTAPIQKDLPVAKVEQDQASKSVHHSLDYSEEDECRPKDYDLMKEKVLNKS